MSRAALGGLLLVPAVPASAGVAGSASLTVPSAVSVGQTSLAGSFTVINANTPPNNLESNTITGLALTMSCGALGSAANPCPTPDPGMFWVNPTAPGAAGTACAGVTFSVSAPNASGTVTFTPSSPVVLAPPGSSPGSGRCKTDLAVFRPSTGVWYVSQSSGGGTATVFGQNGDIPLPLPYAIRRFFP